jgi:glucosamine-6-phosphate deaminase
MINKSDDPIFSGQTDLLQWKVYEDRGAMGMAAARAISKKIRELIAVKDFVNIIFATAPSQNEFLSSLMEMGDLDWSRINAFHQDEYIGLPDTNPQRFGAYFHEHIADRVQLGQFFLLNGNADPDEECQRYSQVLGDYPVDICCGGIGENGHIAFNDPHVADFSDPVLIKKVTLDETCRQQQIHDGCFEKIEDVPKMAITLTVPALMRASSVLVIVPGSTKAEAVRRALTDPISEDFPATIYRRHRSAVLYLDRESASLIL